MKKILYINTVSSVFNIPFWKAFEALGFEVHFVDWRGHPFLEIGNLIHRTVQKLPEKMRDYLNVQANKKIDERVLEAAKKVKPDYIFVHKAKYIATPVLDELRSIATTINWYPDILNNLGTIERIIDHYDYLFNYDRYMVDLFRGRGYKNFYHLPWAADLDKNAVWPDKRDYKYNVVFIGSYNPQIFPREEELKDLKDLGLHVWGNKAWLKTALKDCYHGFIQPRMDEIQKVYKESKIGLYFDSLYDVPASGVTLRPFEITSGGAMMLGQVFREEMPELWVDRKEYASFNGPDDLREKIAYYLKHEDERREMAKNGFERTRRDHTYYDRIKKIFEIVG